MFDRKLSTYLMYVLSKLSACLERIGLVVVTFGRTIVGVAQDLRDYTYMGGITNRDGRGGAVSEQVRAY